MQEWIELDRQTIWHPCSQMKDYEWFPPIAIARASGCYLETTDGRRIIDAISSWWCKSLGHGHPRLKSALLQQLESFEHVMMANTTGEVLGLLGQRLCQVTQQAFNTHLPYKVFFASDGSSAVEVALKMALHAKQLQGASHQKRFLALENAYHGETALCMAVSDVGLYQEPYRPLIPDVCSRLTQVPYVASRNDPLWHDVSDHWATWEAQLEPLAKELCAIIIEPIVQGAGGMRLYSKDFLRRIALWAEAHDIFIIADEIMTGLGRTGLPFAIQHAEVTPDFICLSKGLTSGWLPMSVVIVNEDIYRLFYDDYEKGKSFLHSHTYSGNALAASVALATLSVLEEEHIYEKVSRLESVLIKHMQQVADETRVLTHVRGLGALVAADLVPHPHAPARLGFHIYKKAVELGALLRPLGNTLYWLPPLNIELETVRELARITARAIREVE